MANQDLSEYKNKLGRKHQVIRFIWDIAWLLFARPLPRSFGNGWRLFLLRLFGAKLHRTAVVYSSVRVYYPANLFMAEHSCLAPEVDCYNVDQITIGANTTVSQKTYLCTASHDISQPNLPLIHKPIVIEDQVWVAAEAFIGPGVTIGQGSVVAARAVVMKDVPAWKVAGGNPAKILKDRVIHES